MGKRPFESLRILAGQVLREERRAAQPAGRQERAGIVRLADFLLDEAIACGASDLHLEPQAGELRLRLSDTDIRVAEGPEGLLEAACRSC